MPGNLFLLILKNKMAATGVNKMAAVDFFSTLSKGLIAQKVLQLQFFRVLFSPMVSGWAGVRAGGGRVGGRREIVCPGCISETVRCRKLILGRDIG